MQLPLNKSTLGCWKNNFRQISYMLYVHVKMKGLQNSMKYYLYVLRVTYMYLPVVFTCTWCINLCYLPVFICCIYLLCVLVVSTCCIYLLYLPVEPIFVSTYTFCNYKKCTCCIYLLYLPVVHFVVLPSPAKELVGVPVHRQHLFLGHRWHAPKYGRVWQSETGQLIMIDWCVHMCNLCYMYQMCIPLKRDTLPLMISKAVGHKKSHLISF